MNNSCDKYITLLDGWNVRVTCIWEHDLSCCAMHYHFQITIVFTNNSWVVLRRNLHRHLHLYLILEVIKINIYELICSNHYQYLIKLLTEKLSHMWLIRRRVASFT